MPTYRTPVFTIAVPLGVTPEREAELRAADAFKGLHIENGCEIRRIVGQAHVEGGPPARKEGILWTDCTGAPVDELSESIRMDITGGVPGAWKDHAHIVDGGDHFLVTTDSPYAPTTPGWSQVGA